MHSPSIVTESFEHRDAELHFLDRGQGPALLLVHGHPFDSSMWWPQVDAFAASMRVIAPDLSGYGRSSVRATTTTLSDFSDDLAALLDHVGVPDAVVCGLSMGGQVAMEFLGHTRNAFAV